MEKLVREFIRHERDRLKRTKIPTMGRGPYRLSTKQSLDPELNGTWIPVMVTSKYQRPPSAETQRLWYEGTSE